MGARNLEAEVSLPFSRFFSRPDHADARRPVRSRSVVFVDTDGIDAHQRRDGSSIDNPTEAHLVQQVRHLPLRSAEAISSHRPTSCSSSLA